MTGPMHEFTTLGGDVVHTPLNLNREQWETYQASPDAPTVSDLWALADVLLGEEAAKLGAMDVARWGREWNEALRGALAPGESDGSTEPSTEHTGPRSRSTSGGSRASRSRK